jgi:hypothetical protein
MLCKEYNALHTIWVVGNPMLFLICFMLEHSFSEKQLNLRCGRHTLLCPFLLLYSVQVYTVQKCGLNSHQWGWYNCTKVCHPKLHQQGKRLNQYWLLFWPQLVWPWHLSPCFGLEFDFNNIFLWGWHSWSSSLDLRVVNNLCTHALPSFYLLWFLNFVSNIFLKGGNDGLGISR